MICAGFMVDRYSVAVAERTFEELNSERILNQSLNGTFERTRSERRVITFGCNQVGGRGTDLQLYTTFGQQLAQTRQLELDDSTKLFTTQRSEHDDIVYPVQELRSKMATKFSQHVCLDLVPVCTACSLQYVRAADVRGHDDHRIA